MLPDKRITPIEMSREEFRRVGHYLIDRIADFLHTLDKGPVTTGETPAQLQALLEIDSLPNDGIPADSIIKKASDLLFNHSLFNGHPKFLGYITSSPAPIGMLSDLLGAAINPNVGANILSPMATEIEKQTVKWLAELIGVSPAYGGILVSGGNMANFTAFIAARTAKTAKSLKEQGLTNVNRQLVIYCSRATHAWIEKAVFFFGIGTNSIRWIDQDSSNRICIDLLEWEIQEDLQKGYLPFMVIGTAGDVSTGAIDDLKSIGRLCKTHDLWFHIDGAYGMPAAVIPELKDLFQGVEDADSIALDPHKWLYSPLEAGCTLVKDPQTLINAYSAHPVYYNFDDPASETLNYYEYGFQNSRSFRALKVWTALQQVGRNGYASMIREDIELSKLLFYLAKNHAELEAVTQNLSITTFRYVPIDVSYAEQREAYLNEFNETLLNILQRKGEVFLSNAVVSGRYCLRACIVNFRTTRKDIEEIAYLVVNEGRKLYARELKHIQPNG